MYASSESGLWAQTISVTELGVIILVFWRAFHILPFGYASRSRRHRRTHAFRLHRGWPRGIEQGLRSLLAQDYPNLEVIAIDDRSVDGTGRVIDRLAASDARLRAIHIRDLPAGWLGKSRSAYGSGTSQG
jgi:cellulose synthase/poly-beta-1,6-N-acetylglucosamine synthase-like glycosyltransferase